MLRLRRRWGLPDAGWGAVSGRVCRASRHLGVPVWYIHSPCVHLSAERSELRIYGTVHSSSLKINEHAFLLTNKHLAPWLVIGNRFILISVYLRLKLVLKKGLLGFQR